MRHRPTNRHGFALESTLLLLVVIAGLIALTVSATLMTQRTGGADLRSTRVQYATEAGADAVVSQLAAFIAGDGVISQDELDAITAPSMPGFTFSQLSAARVGTPTVATLGNGPFAGLYGLNQAIDITVEARDASFNRYRSILEVNAQSIPLFQFGVFYEKDLEILNGPRLDFEGWVHSNGDIYLSSANQYFWDQITTADSVFHRRKNTAEQLNGTYIRNDAGTFVPLAFDSRSYGAPADFVARSNRDFDGKLKTVQSGVTRLRLPLPDSVPPEAMVAPRNVADNAALREVKFAWKADMYVTIDLFTLQTVCTQFPAAIADPRTGGRERIPQSNCTSTSGGPIFAGKYNAFHEGREGIGVDVLDIDVGRLQDWVNGSPSTRQVGVLYVNFINTDPSPTSLANIQKYDYPAVRLINGATLDYPLTIATNAPLYIQGNFNSNGWQPASVLADALTILSNGWSDAAHPWNPAWATTPGTNNPYPYTTASNTAVYAAVAAGHSATPCDVNRTAPACDPLTAGTAPRPPLTANNSYGGGLENFPRFLENWGGVTMLYRGSLVSLYESQLARRNRWAWRTYYGAPTRDWRFDLRFRDPAQLPPGTPTVGSVVQTSYRPVF